MPEKITNHACHPGLSKKALGVKELMIAKIIADAATI